MKMSKMFLAAATFVLLIGPLNAHANIIYNWAGDCDGIITPVHGGGSIGCSGQATLHVVTTNDYIPGETFTPHLGCTATTCTPVSTPVLLEFLYSDDNIKVDLAPNWLFDSGFFLLPASLPGEGSFLTTAHFFRSDVNGVWRHEGESLRPGCDTGIDTICGYDAKGFNGVWTRVPTPSTLVLLGVSLAGLVLYRRRKVT